MRGTLNTGQTDRVTDWRHVAARAVGAVADTAQHVTAQVITWTAYRYAPDFHPMLHIGKDAR